MYCLLEPDFCGKTILVVLEPSISHYTGTLDISFFGSNKIKSVKNIFQITNQTAIDALIEQGREFRSIYKITLHEDSKAGVLSVINDIKKIKGVEVAIPDYIGFVTTAVIPNDPHWDHFGLWPLRNPVGIKATESWNLTTGSRKINVGVIDTGIGGPNIFTPNDGHDDLNYSLEPGWNFADDSPFNTFDSCYFSDTSHGHGTKTAGIIGAKGNNSLGTVGVNWEVGIVPLKISNDPDSGAHHSLMTEAIEYATRFWGIRGQISILNLSYSGYGWTSGVHAAINNFPGLMVWSAGNEGLDTDLMEYIDLYDLENLIVVGANDSLDNRSIWESGGSSNWSSSGENVHIFAPGSDGFTTSSDGLYEFFDGTSMSAPHVAGVAALMLSLNPYLAPSDIKSIIVDTGTEILIEVPGYPFEQYVKK